MPKLSTRIPWTKFYVLLLICLLLVVAGFSSYRHLQALYYERVEQNFKSQISTLHQSVSAWGRSKRHFAHSWARQPELTRYALTISSGGPELRKLSRFSLDDYLRPAVSDPEIRHYYLVGEGGRIISSSDPDHEPVMEPLMRFPYLLKQVWGGLSVITYPVRLASQNESLIYVAAPIKDAASKPIALLVFSVDPMVSFNTIFRKTIFSEAGVAYAYNRDGFVLTPVDSQRLAWRAPVAGVQSAVLGNAPGESKGELKTSLATRLGLQQHEIFVHQPVAGWDGQDKVGAWVWDTQFQMGVALEQSADEGFQFLQKMQLIFLSFIFVVVMISMTFFFSLSYVSAARSRSEEEARDVLAQELQLVHEKNTLEIADREAKHRAIIDTAWDAIFTVDTHGVILSANPATSRIFGCQYKDLEGKLLEDYVWPDGSERLTADYLQRVSGQSIEAAGIRVDRKMFPVAASISWSQTSRYEFYTVIIRDISEQKESEASLLSTQKRLEMSQSFAFIGTWEWNVRLDQVLATDMALQLVGVGAERSPVGLGVFFSRLQYGDRSSLNRAIHASIASMESFSVECRVEGDEQADWLLIEGTPLYEQGAVTLFVGHIQRITERKAGEKALLDTRNMLRLVLDTVPIGVYWKNKQHKIAGVNRRFCEDVGFSEDFIVGKTEREIYSHQEQALLVERLDQMVIESGQSIVTESGRYYMNNGQVRFIEVSRLPILDADKNTLGMLGVYSDVTERLETQNSLKRHHQLLASIYSSQLRYFAGDNRSEIFTALLNEVLSLTESEYGFIGRALFKQDGSPYLKTYSITDIAWNEETKALYQKAQSDGMEFHNLETLFGYSLKTAELVISNDPASDPRAKGLPPGHPVMHAFLGVPLMKGNQLVGMIGLANRKGGYDEELVNFLQPMFTTCSNLIDAIDNDARMTLAQQQLISAKDAAEKASQAKTEFLSRVSHELRTPMNAILGFTGLLYDSCQEDEQKTFLSEIQSAGNHLMSLINEVLDLERIESGRIDLQYESVCLDTMFQECSTVIGQLAAQQQVSLMVASDSLPGLCVQADKGRLRQIILNLLSNAVKYNRPGGYVSLKAFSLDGKTCIEIRDSGVGMSEEELSHLFESFNRLHAEHTNIEGSGMGLVITRQLAELMGGELTVESTKHKGSCFVVSLPDMSLPESERLLPGQMNKSVLVLDELDSNFCASDLEALLSVCDIERVDTAIGFLEAALQKSYSLIICNAAASDMTERELIEYLEDAGVLTHTLLFMVSDSAVDFALERKEGGEGNPSGYDGQRQLDEFAGIYQGTKSSTPHALMEKIRCLLDKDQGFSQERR